MIANLPVEEPELCQAAMEAAASASKRPRPHHKFEATQHGEVMRVNGKRLSSGETAPMDPSIPGYRDGNGRTLSLNDSKREEDEERPSRYMRVDVDGATDPATATMETVNSREAEAEYADADQQQHQQQQESDPQKPVPILNPPPLESDDLSDDVPAPWIMDDDDDTVLPLPDTSKLYAPPSDAQQQEQQQQLQLNEFMSLSVLDGGHDAYCKVMQPKVSLVPPEFPPSVTVNAVGMQVEQTEATEHHHQQQEQQQQEQPQTQVTREPDSNVLMGEFSKDNAQETEVPVNGEGSFVPSTEARVSSASALPDTPAEEKNGDEQPALALNEAQEQPQGEEGGNILETLMKMTSPLSGVETLSPPGDSEEDVAGVGGGMNEWSETLGLDDGNEAQGVMPLLEQRACKLDMDVDLDLDLRSDELKEPLEDSAVEDLFGAEDGLECLI